jgi:hypothetical protein
MLNLAQASTTTGTNWSSILRAIKPARQDAQPNALAAYQLALAEERIAELKERLEEMRLERDRARAGEDAWKTQCEIVSRHLCEVVSRQLRGVVSRQLALPAPHDGAPEPSRFRRAWHWMQARTGQLQSTG